MKKNVVKMNENAIRQIVAECVKNALMEIAEPTPEQEEKSYQANLILQKAYIALCKAEDKITKLFGNDRDGAKSSLKILHDARTPFFESGIGAGEIRRNGDYTEPDNLDGAGYQY